MSSVKQVETNQIKHFSHQSFSHYHTAYFFFWVNQIILRTSGAPTFQFDYPRPTFSRNPNRVQTHKKEIKKTYREPWEYEGSCLRWHSSPERYHASHEEWHRSATVTDLSSQTCICSPQPKNPQPHIQSWSEGDKINTQINKYQSKS